MLHAALSPVAVPNGLCEQLGISKRAIQLAEEVRINFVGAFMADWYQSVGGDIRKLTDGTEKFLCDTICETRKWDDAVNLYLATLNTDVHKAVKRRLRRVPEWRDPLEAIHRLIGAAGLLPHKRYRDHHAFSVARETDPTAFHWVDDKGAENVTMLNLGFTSMTLPLAASIDSWLSNPPGDPKGSTPRPEKAQRRVIQNADKWQAFVLGPTSLTETTTSFLGRRKRPSMTGKYPSRPDRLLTDPERRIFRETVRSRGGVVVFDCSGSMGVTHEIVRDAVKQFAGATVLVYSDTGRRFAPNAWVVARNGRMVSSAEFDELPLHSGNGVDGPALRWALRQRKTPKDFVLWVSDGGVTGRHDRSDVGLLDECAELSRRHNIIGVDTCEEAIELLADMKRTGATPRNRYCRVVAAKLRKLTVIDEGE